ncbi:MAG: efflux RND transporter periplasmic adaptor subunit [Planctomycetes bacterium]|nr:efflux RND transporter periplasmic adaptor subunit [Planctomycetota bacterium]
MSIATAIAPASTPPNAVRSNISLRRFTPLLFLAAGAGLGVGTTMYLSPPPNPTPVSPSEPEKSESSVVTFEREKWQASGIRTQAAQTAPLTDHVWRTGRVMLDEDRVSHICPLVEGLIVEVPVRLGQDVAAGTVLAVLESREIGQAKLDLVTAKLAATSERERAGWASDSAANMADLIKAVLAGNAIAEIDTAFKDRPVGERRQTLMAAYSQRNHLRGLLANQKALSGTVAGATLQKTEAEFDAAEASLRALCEEFRFQATQQSRQSELKLQETLAGFAAARTRLLTLGFTPAQVDAMDPIKEGAAASRFEVKAPFAGTVVEKHAIRSERVGLQSQLFQIADLSAVWVQADAFEADLPLLHQLKGSGVVFRAPMAGVSERAAGVLYAGDLVDRASRALTVTATAQNPGRVLKPGMYVEVGIPRGGVEPVLQVPASAIQRHQGKSFVFVHVKDGEFHRVDVELGRQGGDRVEVTAGLSPGDEVVVERGFVLKSALFRDQLTSE